MPRYRMRTIATLLMTALPLISLLGARSEDPDPDSLRAVSFELKMNSGGRRVVHGWSQKHLARLGDRVSIALLKILGDQDLEDPATVMDFLPIIRTSFSTPQFISIESDRKPRVTLFLLQHLEQTVHDPAVRQEIRQTAEFVKSKSD
jgi:hypothetical protein